MTDRLKCLIPTIGCPAELHGKEGRYALAAFYGELLDMEIVNEGWLLIAELGADNKLFLALDGDGWSDHRPPRWPDPEYPQQMHLDILVPELEPAAALVSGLGASLLRDSGDFRVFADPVGHPFCLYPDRSTTKPLVGRLVFDCFSPRLMAGFYERFLGARGRVEDSPERVVVDLGDDKLPDLAFQHAQFVAARWPDPAYPAQLHVDYRWHDSLTARAALERAESLGAVRLPQLADTWIYGDPASHPFCIQNDIPIAFDIVGLYLNPPQYAVAYAVDTTTRMPASSREGPVPPMLADISMPPTDEAGSDSGAGVLGDAFDMGTDMSGSRDRGGDLAGFLTTVNSNVPPHLEVNLVCDWDDAYQSAVVQRIVSDQSRFEVHRNPPDAQWSDQIEQWLTYVTNHLTRRGDNAALQALRNDIRSWATGRSTNPDPFRWTKNADQISGALSRRGSD